MADKAKAEEGAKKAMPKGGRKGGTMFPRTPLDKALGYSENLVRKTHSGAQPVQTILVGVFKNKGDDGKVRASALRQFGLLEGDADGYSASQLAREIEATPKTEQHIVIQRAFFNAKLFKQLYDTFQSDTVSRAKLRQAAVTAKVHPDTGLECVDCFVSSAVTAGLATEIDAENVAITAASTLNAPPVVTEPAPDALPADEEGTPAAEVTPPPPKPATSAAKQTGSGDGTTRTGAQLQLHVDSSSDPDKLRKQLELLREFGMI
jgi:hypothetical protein